MKKNKDISLLIIPDVHGRTHWKKAKDYPGVKKVFLGDYLDPYTSMEGISKSDAILNFVDLLEFANAKSDEVTMLYGNHDVSYTIDADLCRCRHDFANDVMIEEMFSANESLFSWTLSHETNGRKYVLSHAGIMEKWLVAISSNYEAPMTLERIYREGFGKGDGKGRLTAMLDAIPESRGGYKDHGSLVWASSEDHIGERRSWKSSPEIMQIAGHTWMSSPIEYKGISIIDTGGPLFYVDGEGTLRSLDDDSTVPSILV